MNNPEQTRQHLRSLSRRDFVRMAGGCSALTSTSLLSTLVNLKLTNSTMAQLGGGDGYKALVCLFLFGGNDSYNMLTPYDNDEYADYQTIRTNLALQKDGEPGNSLLQVSDGGRSYGIHPALSDFKDMYDAGNLAFVANTGSLVEPITDTVDFRSSKKPLGLFSHSDLTQHWQTGLPQSRSSVNGWAGRMADLLNDSTNSNESISMNISLNGLNLMQTGATVTPYVISSGGATRVSYYQPGTTNVRNKMYTQMMDGLTTRTYTDLLEQSFATSQRKAIDAAIAYNDATNAITLDTVFPDTGLGNNLKRVAQTIGARSSIGQTRQVFFVSLGGWDHHDDLTEAQMLKFQEMGPALKAFYDATAELNVANDVTTFSASDFARTLSSNGNGSDHAWGGNQFMIGGGVDGGKVYGSYPQSLAPGNDLDLGRGRLIPTTSVDEYAAELAMWFGVPNDGNMTEILPNLRNFHAAGASKPLNIL